MPVAWRLYEEVRARAGRRCEYCLYPEDQAFARHQVDHIIAEKHGGATIPGNLALCCALCNMRKGSDLSTLDPMTGVLTPLFHPRLDVWMDHFELQDNGEIVARTSAGRATVQLLRMNRPDRVKEREPLVRSGRLWVRGS